jgi:CubicO group peptidase (beta-lactamase class C family)
MKLSRRSALVATGLGLIGPRVLAQTDAGVSRETFNKHLSALDNYVVETLKRTGVPGLSVAIAYKDQVVYLKGFGVRQAGKSEPVDPDTVFQLASMSKPIASTVVAALAGDGLVALDLTRREDRRRHCHV